MESCIFLFLEVPVPPTGDLLRVADRVGEGSCGEGSCEDGGGGVGEALRPSSIAKVDWDRNIAGVLAGILMRREGTDVEADGVGSEVGGGACIVMDGRVGVILGALDVGVKWMGKDLDRTIWPVSDGGGLIGTPPSGSFHSAGNISIGYFTLTIACRPRAVPSSVKILGVLHLEPHPTHLWCTELPLALVLINWPHCKWHTTRRPWGRLTANFA